MPAYIVLQSTVKDEAQYQKYAQAAWPLMVRFGAKLVARRRKGGDTRRRTRSAARLDV